MMNLLNIFTCFVVGVTAIAPPAHRLLRRGHSHSNVTLVRRDNFGPGTFYDITAGVTACGGRYSASDHVIAMNAGQFEGSCGKTVTITYGGKSITATVVDRCEICDDGCDMTEGLFQELAPLSAGRIQIQWSFGSGSPPPPKETPTTTQAPKATTTTWTPEATTTTTTTHSHSHHSSSSSSTTSSTTSSTSTSDSAQATQTPASQGNVAGALEALSQMGNLLANAANAAS